MREAFKDYGQVVTTEVQIDERGKSKGFGIVIFEEREAAEEAIRSMD